MNSRLTKKLLTVVFVCGWLTAAGWGMWRLAAYSLAPGAQGNAPTDWPNDTTLARDPANFTAVVALHPECPCSEATVEELDSIVANSGGKVRVHALFVDLPGFPEPADHSDLWQRTHRITGVLLEKDSGGIEARRFDVQTSGEVHLYDAHGHLLFHGGITTARGHVGDNPGQAAVEDLIHHRIAPSTPIRTPVFGCALWNKTTAKP